MDALEAATTEFKEELKDMRNMITDLKVSIAQLRIEVDIQKDLLKEFREHCDALNKDVEELQIKLVSKNGNGKGTTELALKAVLALIAIVAALLGFSKLS